MKRQQIDNIIEWVLNRRWLLRLLLVFVAAYAFLELSADVWLNEGFDWDAPIMQAFNDLRSPALDITFSLITESVGWLIFIPLLMFAYWFWRRDMRRHISLLLFSVLGMALLSSLLKLLFQRPRQDIFEPIVLQTSYSFPSGHSASAVALFGLMSLFLWRSRHYLAAVLCWIWVLLVMLSRIYLGAHYPSDVLASLALGIVWIILLYSVRPRQRG